MTISADIADINDRAEKLGRALTAFAKILLFAMFAGSVALAVFGISMDFDKPFPGAGVILIFTAAIPGLLQMIDWLWAGAPIGKYRAIFIALRKQAVQLIKRRRLGAYFATLGREEVASRELSTDEASYFSIPAQMRRRKRHRIAAYGAAFVTAIAVYGQYIATPEGAKTRYYAIGQELALDEITMVSVTGRPRCGITDKISSEPTCQVILHLRNVGRFQNYVGVFNNLLDSTPTVDAPIVAIMSKGNYYEYRETLNPKSQPPDWIRSIRLNPGEATDLLLAFEVPTGIQPDTLRFYVGDEGSRERIDVSLVAE